LCKIEGVTNVGKIKGVLSLEGKNCSKCGEHQGGCHRKKRGTEKGQEPPDPNPKQSPRMGGPPTVGGVVKVKTITAPP